MKRQYPTPVYSYPKPAPRPVVRKIYEDQSPSAEMRKWLLEGHKNDFLNISCQNKNIVF